MRTWEVKKGERGSRGPRRGSKRPQFGLGSVVVGWWFALVVWESRASFLPFRLPLRAPAPGLVGAFVETAAVRALVMSLTYCVWPAWAPPSIGPGRGVSLVLGGS